MKPNNIIEIYTTKNCSYCKKAKIIFEKYSINYIEHDVENSKDREIMQKRSHGNYTVPQIFVNNDLIGGFDELESLHINDNLKGLFH